jgi:hypothetical protein
MNANGSARDARETDDDDVVVRKAEHGWVVGGEEVSDLTSAMVLADLFAADHAAYEEGHAAGSAAEDSSGGGGAGERGGRLPGPPRQGRSPAATRPEPVMNVEPRFVPKSEIEADEAARLAVTVTQLEHALASRVRVEQAIGVLAERHKVRPREAFDLLRGAARSRGKRITDISEDVVASTANPLLRLPDELARQAQPKQRSLRRRRLLPRRRR